MLDEWRAEVRRRLIGFPSRSAVAADASYLHVGGRSFTRRVAANGRELVKKTFVRTAKAREAFAAERMAHEHLAAMPWIAPWRGAGSRWYVRDYYGDESRFDRVVAKADAARRRELAAAVAGIALDLHCEGIAHRDLHARNVFVADDGLRVIDLETCVRFPPSYQPDFPQTYDVTGHGLESPWYTNHMGFDDVAHETSFRNVLGMEFRDAFRPLAERLDSAALKDALRTASLAFATKDKDRGRHTCKSGRIYCSFALPRLVVTPDEAQRDSAKRFARFGVGDADLRGRSVLDLGSNVGGMVFAAQRFGPARSVGVEYDRDKVSVARRVAALGELKDVAFVCADVDAIDASSIRGPFDVVFCLAIEAHVKDKPHLYALLAQATSRLCLFEGNDKTDPKEAADSLRRAGFREVEALGVCDDDCRPENNVRPILRATK